MLAALDWTSWDFYHYLTVAGVVVIAAAVAVYAVPGGKLKVPGIALSIVGGLGVGLALGVILMGWNGYELRKPDSPSEGAPQAAGPPGMGQMGMMNVQMPQMGGRGGGGGGPNYKQQLATLVVKLDVLTEKPLTIQLSDEQRKEVKEQLKGLADADELSDDDAKAKFEKLHEVLDDQTDTLRAAGYNWPGEGGRGGGGFGGGRGGRGGADQPKNPFTTEPNGQHLKALTTRLDK